MKKRVPLALDEGRLRIGEWASHTSDGFNGAFQIRSPFGTDLRIICSDDAGWEHVSVSLLNRAPNWQEMCFVKDLCWDEEECVVQYHPAKSQYVNCHPNCLHLWKPKKAVIPTPPSWMVGPR